jgi:hypothetical protein
MCGSSSGRQQRFAGVMLATGRLQREGDIIHVVCERLDDVSALLADLDSRAKFSVRAW